MRSCWVRVVWLLASLLMAGQTLAETIIKDVRLWESPDEARLVFDLDKTIEYRIFSLSNPARVVIDMEHTRLKTDTRDIAKQAKVISSVRTGKLKNGGLRLVLDVSEKVTPASFTLKPNETHPNYRLVVDLKRAQTSAPTPSRTVSAKRAPKRDVIIAIDAGHGGEDPGAIGQGGVREKNIVLAIAKELSALLKREPGFKPYMVRSGDYYVGLRERTIKARKANADFFISIHADAFKNPLARGSSVFTLSKRGATSETARWLADKENQADLVGGVSLDDKEDHLAMTLLDLSMTHKRMASVGMGTGILGRLKSISRLHKTRVEEAAFVVLKSPDIPSLLIETGFISNPGEAKKLSSKRYQKKMASSIFSGIKMYFQQRPPQGTWLAWKKNPKAYQTVVAPKESHVDRVVRELTQGVKARIYKVQSGDTLSAIAIKHRVSTKALKSANDMKNDRIFVGQRLTIPAS